MARCLLGCDEDHEAISVFGTTLIGCPQVPPHLLVTVQPQGEPEIMKPTIGRIVLFHYERSSNRGMRTRPAIVTDVNLDGSIDLEVFGNIEIDGIGKYHAGVAQVSGDAAAGPGTWCWPPREPAPGPASTPREPDVFAQALGYLQDRLVVAEKAIEDIATWPEGIEREFEKLRGAVSATDPTVPPIDPLPES